MQDIQFDAHDQQVVAVLKELSDGTTAGEYFARALELGATPVLLAYVAHGFTTRGGSDGYDIVGLPYVEAMLDAGRSNADARAVLEILCFDESTYEGCGSHRQGFWNDMETWNVFDGDTFVDFMARYAATYEGARYVLTEDGHNRLESALVMWRDTPQEYQRDIRSIEVVAAGHITHIVDEYQLRQMIRYAIIGRDDRETHKRLAIRAQSVSAWGWSLVFRGYVLAKLPLYGAEAGYTMQGILQFLGRRPELAPVIFRWLAEGFYREHNEFWELRLDDRHIKGLFTTAGWHFLKVGRTMDGTLQVKFQHRGQQVVVRHTPGDEELTLGDEVMVSYEQLKVLRPRHTPGGELYELTLIPARRPTAEQLADIRGQFPVKK